MRSAERRVDKVVGRTVRSACVRSLLLGVRGHVDCAEGTGRCRHISLRRDRTGVRIRGVFGHKKSHGPYRHGARRDW